MKRIEKATGLSENDYWELIFKGGTSVVSDLKSDDGVIMYGSLREGYIVSSWNQQVKSEFLFVAIDVFNNLRGD